eukprot:8630581-Pyramimonas_sp.AAC.1
MASAQIRTALSLPSCPRWARRVLMTMPSEMTFHIKNGAVEWFQHQQSNLLQSVGSGAAMYLLFGHSGLHIGKANVARAK